MKAFYDHKFAITGHTSGIGNAIYEELNCIGFSRGNGYDIKLPKCRKEITQQLSHDRIDVFINNAHGGFAQAEMLKDVFDVWRYTDKHIINIGVDKVDVRTWELVHETYSVEKLASHAMCDQLQSLERKCKITNLCLGVVENWNGNLTYKNIINAIEYIVKANFEVSRMNIK